MGLSVKTEMHPSTAETVLVPFPGTVLGARDTALNLTQLTAYNMDRH